MTIFSWCNFYKIFAQRLLKYRSNRTELIEIIKSVYSENNIKLPTLEKDNNVIDMDPFTVFGLFNKQITIDKRKKILKGFSQKLNIIEEIPEDFIGIPVLNNLNATFYGFIQERSSSDIDDLWKLFEEALKFNKTEMLPSEELMINFNKVINQKWNGNSKISMGLFWISPDHFLNLDSRNIWYIYESEKLPQKFISTLPKVEKNITAQKYFEILGKINDFLHSDESELKTFAELSAEAWRYSEIVNEQQGCWHPKDYDPRISADKWLEMLNDPTIFDTVSLEMLKQISECGEEFTFHQLEYKYCKSEKYYKTKLMELAERIVNKTKCHVYGNSWTNWFAILYQYQHPNAKKIRLRLELAEALMRLNQPKSKPAEEVIIHSENTYTQENFLSEVYITKEKYDSLVRMLKTKKNIILQGAPGVGKTFAAKRLAFSMMGEKDHSRIEFVQFHQNYSYEDFVMGYKPDGDSFTLKNGVFYEFCKKAEDDPGKEYFFIIDEINRGNMSKIFGELLMLIEKDYRGESMKLAYSEIPFSVPKNLYIIGMMNTADRSLAMIDYALRRRFSFFDIDPGFKSDGFKAYQKSFNSRKLDNLVEKIIELNQEITDDKSLGKGFCIGHSYLCDPENCAETNLKNVVEFDILPMLAEYWFDEMEIYEKWKTILTDAVK